MVDKLIGDLERPSTCMSYRYRVAIGWKDIVADHYAHAGMSDIEHPSPCPNQDIFNSATSKPTQPVLHLNLRSERVPLPGTLLGLFGPKGQRTLTFVNTSRRSATGWDLSLNLLTQEHRICNARTLDAQWPDGNRGVVNVIDLKPTDLPEGQRALLVKASRTASLTLCMPTRIELDGERWLRASRPAQKDHLVSCTWSKL